MGPALKDGDRILVNKMIKGARLFNVLWITKMLLFTGCRDWGILKEMMYWFLIFLIR